MPFSEFGASPATMRNWLPLVVRNVGSVPVVVHAAWQIVRRQR